MELELSQLREKNRLGAIMNFVIAASVIVVTVAEVVQTFSVPILVRLIVAIADVLINAVAIKVWSESEHYRHACGVGMCLLSVIVLFTSTQPYALVLVFPIAVMVLIFQNMQMTIAGSALAMMEAVCYMLYGVFKGTVDMQFAIVNIGVVGMTVYLCFEVTKQLHAHGTERLDAVKEGADAQTRVAERIVELAEELKRKFDDAQEVSDNLNESMQNAYDAMQEIVNSTRVNAEAIVSQTDKTSDIQNSIEVVGGEAQKMEEVSEKTNATVKDGVDLVKRLEKQAEEVVQINVKTRETTQGLNESIKDVEAITATILGISNQTNLLALNASIEAARAGEAGRGFAVVADEIRELSEGTKDATEQITTIIDRLARDAESAADSMTQSAEYADKQHELINETGSKLMDIKNETEVLYDGVLEVRKSVDSVIAANSAIMDSITNLSATGQEVAASTDTTMEVSEASMKGLEQMNALLHEIHRISDQMQELAMKK
ncbi:methyl-accepting chemotaxis protein [Lachnospiraceae bacterium XBB1006]|nr:methyl-accepting chemotaxis protein [Lachnospiraceae bacterium XBB1006]